MHVNTLLYRVGRIEQILGRKLDDPEVRMAMAVALRARRLVAGLEGVIDGARAERRGPRRRMRPRRTAARRSASSRGAAS